MRYHAFVSETDAVEFWYDGRLLATIDGQGVIRYTPVILSMAPELFPRLARARYSDS